MFLGIFPGDHVGHDPRNQNGADPREPENHSNGTLVIPAQNNMVHVAHEPRQDYQPDMDYEEDEVTDQKEKMNGSSRLPASKKLRVPRESVDSRGIHRDAGEHRKRRHAMKITAK